MAVAEQSLSNDETEGTEGFVRRSSRSSWARSVCQRLKGAIGVKENLDLISRERWRVETQFFSMFLAEPVIGIFSGRETASIKTLIEVLDFDTACQAARNATRRIPWLLRLSLVMWFL